MAMVQTDDSGKKWLVSYADGVETGREAYGSGGSGLHIQTGPMRGRSTSTGAGNWLGQGDDPLDKLRNISPKNYFRNPLSDSPRDRNVQRGNVEDRAGNNFMSRSEQLANSTKRADNEFMANSGTQATHRGQMDPFEQGQVNQWMTERGRGEAPTMNAYSPTHSTQYYDSMMSDQARRRNAHIDSIYEDSWGDDQSQLDNWNNILGQDNNIAYEDTAYGKSAMASAAAIRANDTDNSLSWSPGWGERQSWNRAKRSFGRAPNTRHSAGQMVGTMMQARAEYDWQQEHGARNTSIHVKNYSDEAIAAMQKKADQEANDAYNGWENYFKRDPEKTYRI